MPVYPGTMISKSDSYLVRKSTEGLAKKGLRTNIEYQDRLSEELQTIVECGLSDFILNTAYTVLLCKSKGILVGPGRGSVGGSLVAYCVGITEIDPIKYGLSFSRFLNKARMMTSLGDIDIDIPRKDRPYVLELLKEEFGEDKTIQIINDVYFTEKTTLKDLGRIFDIDFKITNKLTSLIGEEDDVYDVPEIVDFFKTYPKIEEAYPKVKGLIRHSSTHAGGVLISDKPITEYISPLKVGKNIVTCYNGRTCESLSFLKQDMLGLNTLSIIKDCLCLLGKDKFDFDYDLDDPKVYETINYSTLGIFQLEGEGATEYTKRLKPKDFNDIIADLALVRPGAQDSGDADEFLKVRFEGKEIEYDHPLLKPILKETNGCILYQEQAMEISKVLSGFTDVEADILRKGIGKKLDYIFEEYKPKFINGAIKNGVDESVAEVVWNKIEKSSEYSFNKSHSVGYSLITYQTAYLKAYYPIEYYLSLLNNVYSADKRIKIYSEVKAIDKEIVNPDINISQKITTSDDDKIYLSLPLIKGVGDKAVEKIIENQPYESYEDFCNRCQVNRSVKKALIQAGAFDCFGEDRSRLYNLESGENSVWSDKEKLFREFQVIKINPRGNVLDLYDLEQMGIEKNISSISDLKENKEEYKDFYIKAIVSEFKNKDDYATLSVTDNFDSISIYVVKEFVSRYIDDINLIGSCLILHLHGKGEKYSMLSCLNLDDPKKRVHEYDFYVGNAYKKLKLLQKKNSEVNVGLVYSVRPFKSKAGNQCRWYNIYIDKDTILEDRIVCNKDFPIVDGSFMHFYVQDNPVFLDIRKVE